MLDDRNEAALARLSSDGFNPCAVIETSAGNFQAYLVAELEASSASALPRFLRRTRERSPGFGRGVTFFCPFACSAACSAASCSPSSSRAIDTTNYASLARSLNCQRHTHFTLCLGLCDEQSGWSTPASLRRSGARAQVPGPLPYSMNSILKRPHYV